MIKDNTKRLLFWIFIVIVLLCVCITVDYADDNITVTNENISTCDVKVNDTNKVVELDESNTSFVAKSNDKIYTIKEKTKKVKKPPLITIVAKPSCGCKNGYYWHSRTFVNYCPHCHRYGALYNKHKWQSRYEQELTCKYDDTDYCGVCGKEKYSWSHYYLRSA